MFSKGGNVFMGHSIFYLHTPPPPPPHPQALYEGHLWHRACREIFSEEPTNFESLGGKVHKYHQQKHRFCFNVLLFLYVGVYSRRVLDKGQKSNSVLVAIGLLCPLRSLPRLQSFLLEWFTLSLHVLTQEINIVCFV